MKYFVSLKPNKGQWVTLIIFRAEILEMFKALLNKTGKLAQCWSELLDFRAGSVCMYQRVNTSSYDCPVQRYFKTGMDAIWTEILV